MITVTVGLQAHNWYMDFGWVPNRDKRLPNPANAFFTKKVIQGKNIELPGVPTESADPGQLYIQFLLDRRREINNLGELIAPLNIRFVILFKEVDYKEYDFLFQQQDMELVKESETLYLFRNKQPTALLYEVDQLSVVRDWDELLEVSRQQDINNGVYLIGEATSLSTTPSESRPLSYEKASPGKYVLQERPIKSYVIFAEPYRDGWRMDGKQPLKNLGITNAYEVSDLADGALTYQRFRIYLIGYIVSGLALAALLFCSVRR